MTRIQTNKILRNKTSKHNSLIQYQKKKENKNKQPSPSRFLLYNFLLF